jgi:hypothetical protein
MAMRTFLLWTFFADSALFAVRARLRLRAYSCRWTYWANFLSALRANRARLDILYFGVQLRNLASHSLNPYGVIV